ncbi:hypothetical protein J6590_053383 [Homalodisca vitripennis]|nr:hypothetical protein J6590_053383 [Homalodisca vitripennis]
MQDGGDGDSDSNVDSSTSTSTSTSVVSHALHELCAAVGIDEELTPSSVKPEKLITDYLTSGTTLMDRIMVTGIGVVPCVGLEWDKFP